jgi:hypothetical protein
MSFKKVISIETINKVHETKNITQEIIGTSIHDVPVQYRILSKNDFGIHKNRINLGLFNKKTDFRISEKESIVVLNKETLELQSPTIPEIQNDPENYFLFWKYSFQKRNNNNLIIQDKRTLQKIKVSLTYTFGKLISEYIQYGIQDILYSKEFTEEEKIFLQNFIISVNNKISFNKGILVNSNYKFLLGLSTLFNETGIIPKNINLYSVSLLFNLLEASYSIRKQDDFIVRYKFSSYLYKLLIKNNELEILEDLQFKFRNLKYFIVNGQIKTKYLKFYNDIKDIRSMENNLDPVGINSGEIELIPCTDIVFEKVKVNQDNLKMVDLVMENDNAHNFYLDGLPLLKNSDGDILAAMALFSKEAAKEASENFSASNKTKFVNPANLNIQNWGVKTDSQLGLYNATK